MAKRREPRQVKNMAYRNIGLFRRSVQFRTCEHCNRTMCPICFSIGPSEEDRINKLRKGLENLELEDGIFDEAFEIY